MAMSTTCVYADQHSAMLEQGDSIALFYGADALQQAYAVADSGAVITLSKGLFTGLTIEKSLTLVGYYGFSNDPYRATVISGDLVVAANKTSINGVYVTNELRLHTVSDCTIRHSWLAALATKETTMIHTNTVVDQCVISSYISQAAYAWSKDFVIKNSTIRTYVTNVDNSNPIYCANSLIYLFNRSSATGDNALPYGVFKNNVIMYSGNYDSATNNDDNIYLLSQKYASSYIHNAWCRFEPWSGANCNTERNYGSLASVINDVQIPIDNIFAEFNYQSLRFPAYPINPGLGSDGTPRGPLGGTGFTDRPSIPRITGRDIDLNPDSIGNINVKISVSAE